MKCKNINDGIRRALSREYKNYLFWWYLLKLQDNDIFMGEDYHFESTFENGIIANGKNLDKNIFSEVCLN